MPVLVRCVFAALLFASAARAEEHVNIVALGDDGIRGKGVAEYETLPAQLERALRGRGHDVSVINAGVDGDTTDGVLSRLERDVPQGTKIVILSIGMNDRITGHRSEEYIRANNLQILSRLKARGAQIHTAFALQRGLIDRPELHIETAHDAANADWHLNAEGYAIVAARMLPAIEALVKKAANPAH